MSFTIMKLTIIQTGDVPEALRPRFGAYPPMFQRMFDEAGIDFSYEAIPVHAGATFPDPTRLEAILITGSPAGVYDNHLTWMAPLRAFIRKAYAADRPMVGICFGHQIIAQAMGGKVEKYAGGWTVGPTEYDFGDRTYTLNAWHQDQVVQKPETAKVLASTAMCENAALLYDDRMFTVQPHPEFRKEFMEGLIKVRGPGLVPDALLADATQRLDTPLDSPSMADRIAEFFLTHQAKTTGAEKLRA